jgi:hypothetical protein
MKYKMDQLEGKQEKKILPENILLLATFLFVLEM